MTMLTLRYGCAVLWAAALALTACGEGSSSGAISCGEGTELHDGVCIASASTTPTTTTVAKATTTEVGYDPLAATPDERYDRWVLLASVYGYEVDMRRDESYELAANLCTRDVDEMVVHLSALNMIESPRESANSRAGIADAYCPAMRIVVEAAFHELSISVILPPPTSV